VPHLGEGVRGLRVRVKPKCARCILPKPISPHDAKHYWNRWICSDSSSESSDSLGRFIRTRPGCRRSGWFLRATLLTACRQNDRRFWSLIIASVWVPSKERIYLASGTLEYESPPLTAELQARAIAHSIILYRFRGLLFTASKGPFLPIRAP